MDKNEAGKIAVEYLNANGCLPVSNAKAAMLDDLEKLSADTRVSAEGIGLRVRHFFANRR